MNTVKVIKKIKSLLTDPSNTLNNMVLDCGIRVNGKIYKASCQVENIVPTVFRMIDKPHLIDNSLKGKMVDSIFIQHQNGKILFDSKIYSMDVQKLGLIKSKDTQVDSFVKSTPEERAILLDNLEEKIKKDNPTLETKKSLWDELPMNDLPFLT